MDWNLLNNISIVFTIFGFAVTLATLIFLAYQCHLLKSSLRIQSFQTLFNNIISIDMYFANNPVIKQYVYDNKELQADTESIEHVQAMSACELLLDHFEEVFGCKSVMNKEMWLGWSIYIRKVYNGSNLLREYVGQNRSKYQKDFLALLDNIDNNAH